MVFLRREDDVVRIENFLLSCRVFSRGIEQACLAEVLRQARDTGARAVLAGYRPTAKNGKVADLYPRHGFTPVEGPWPRSFRHDLTELIEIPEHLALTADQEMNAP